MNMSRKKKTINPGTSDQDQDTLKMDNNKLPPVLMGHLDPETSKLIQDELKSCTEVMKLTMSRLELCIMNSEQRIIKLLETKIAALENTVTEVLAKNNELENKIQRLEKVQRKRNIVITGLDTNKEDAVSIIEDLMVQAGKEKAKIKDTWKIQLKSGKYKFIGTCDSFEEKQRIMECKRIMKHKGKPFYLDDDLTEEEQLVQYKARTFARENGVPGLTSVSYRKVWIDGECYEYNNKTGSFLSQKDMD